MSEIVREGDDISLIFTRRGTHLEPSCFCPDLILIKQSYKRRRRSISNHPSLFSNLL